MRLRDMQAAASIGLLLMSVSTQPGMAQQQPRRHAARSVVLRSRWPTIRRDNRDCRRPAPKLTEPLLPARYGDGLYEAEALSGIRLDRTRQRMCRCRRLTTRRIDSLLRDGKIYLSLSDAVALALENNYDIAIARINLDIADTDMLRAKAGSNAARCFDGSGDEYAGRHDRR